MSEHEACIALLVVVVIAELVYAWFAALLANHYRKAYDSALAEYREAVRDLNRTKAEVERLREKASMEWPDELSRFVRYETRSTGWGWFSIVGHLTRCGSGWDKYTVQTRWDIKKCRELLVSVPWLAERFDDMRTCSPLWAKIVDNWDMLCRMSDDSRQCYSIPSLINSWSDDIERRQAVAGLDEEAHS